MSPIFLPLLAGDPPIYTGAGSPEGYICSPFALVAWMHRKEHMEHLDNSRANGKLAPETGLSGRNLFHQSLRSCSIALRLELRLNTI